MKKQITEKDVAYFKESMCNENIIIIDIIKSELQKYFISPVLDVGYGIGDISFSALKEKEVIGIDINKVDESIYPLRENHKRITVDFFHYKPTKTINTLLLSHTLQFLHHDIKNLNNKISEINPKNIILVANKNDDFLGKTINWVYENFENSSPELRLKNFPFNYKLVKEVPFTAFLKCESFNILAEQISYLMLIDIKNREQEVVDFLKKNLEKPEFTINQDILIIIGKSKSTYFKTKSTF